MTEPTSLRRDPYALAYKYWDYIRETPRRKYERLNPYYENLLANQLDPDPEEMDDRSRASSSGWTRKVWDDTWEPQM
jgi:hypothetical protein